MLLHACVHEHPHVHTCHVSTCAPLHRHEKNMHEQMQARNKQSNMNVRTSIHPSVRPSRPSILPASMHLCIHASMHACTHARMHARTHARIQTQMTRSEYAAKPETYLLTLNQTPVCCSSLLFAVAARLHVRNSLTARNMYWSAC